MFLLEVSFMLVEAVVRRLFPSSISLNNVNITYLNSSPSETDKNPDPQSKFYGKT